jgi:DNA ligase 1
VKAFAALIDTLQSTPAPAARVRLLADYFASTPDPDRGWALAVVTKALALPALKAGFVKAFAAAHLEPTLFALSLGFSGDAAETVGLMWPGSAADAPKPAASVAALLPVLPSLDSPSVLARWLDRLDPTARVLLLRLITDTLDLSGLARAAYAALAQLRPDVPRAVALSLVEPLCLGLEPPYAPLFAWLDGTAPPPALGGQPVFRPMMRAAAAAAEPVLTDSAARVAEWHWPGPLVQLVSVGGQRRLYTADGEDLSAAVPDLLATLPEGVVFDGTLFGLRDGAVVAPQLVMQRLRRKRLSARALADLPLHVRVHDVLVLAGDDLRADALTARRHRLQAWFVAQRPLRLELSPLIALSAADSVPQLWAQARPAGARGALLKRGDSPYLAGADHHHWQRWAPPPLHLACVLLYAPAAASAPFGAPPEYTVGAWNDAGALVPIGKAVSALDAPDAAALAAWIRDHVVDRFGPVRQLVPEMVVVVACDAIVRSARHKAGLVLRNARLLRTRAEMTAQAAAQTKDLLSKIE